MSSYPQLSLIRKYALYSDWIEGVHSKAVSLRNHDYLLEAPCRTTSGT